MSRTLYQVVSACLCYPDARLLAQVPLMRTLAEDDGGAPARAGSTPRPTLRERLLGAPPAPEPPPDGWPAGARATCRCLAFSRSSMP